jgi:hypothetical protein
MHRPASPLSPVDAARPFARRAWMVLVLQVGVCEFKALM